ncbi:MAG TPA: hypothetical protein VGI40_27200 [Pirellulaceae bacterium]
MQIEVSCLRADRPLARFGVRGLGSLAGDELLDRRGRQVAPKLEPAAVKYFGQPADDQLGMIGACSLRGQRRLEVGDVLRQRLAGRHGPR